MTERNMVMEKNRIKNYEKPRLTFVSLRDEKSVANTCWGGHGNRLTWYYDTKGKGYVSFQIGGGKCTLNLSNVIYYEEKGEKGTPLNKNDVKYQELYAALESSGGESGNPFKGEGVDFPNTPDPKWS